MKLGHRRPYEYIHGLLPAVTFSIASNEKVCLPSGLPSLLVE